MGRVDPFVTYIGAVALVIGSIGLAFSGEAPKQPPTILDETVATAPPGMAAVPVAFYAETLELIMPRVRRAAPSERAMPVVSGDRLRPAQAPPAQHPPALSRERRSSSFARVIVRRGRSDVVVYQVGREGQ